MDHSDSCYRWLDSFFMHNKSYDFHKNCCQHEHTYQVKQILLWTIQAIINVISDIKLWICTGDGLYQNELYVSPEKDNFNWTMRQMNLMSPSVTEVLGEPQVPDRANMISLVLQISILPRANV